MKSLKIASIVKILGYLLLIEAFLLTVPLCVCLLYGENDWKAFAIAAGAALLAGTAMRFTVPAGNVAVRSREGFIITSLVWLIYAGFGMIPLMLCSTPLSLTDAAFEVISGFTTTGASVIADVDACSHGILFWRAFTQWIGGLGIILFLLALLPEFNHSSGISMFNAEATGITHAKLHPRIRQTALTIWILYAGLTLLSVLLLWAGPMNLFDSVCQTFAAIATGGFSTHNEGIMYWQSDYVLVVVTFIMLIAGTNFFLLYNTLKSGPRCLWHNDVFRNYVWIVLAVSALLIGICLLGGSPSSLPELILYPVFHVVSAITSTGFSVSGSQSWGSAALCLTLFLMICGSCTGSTTGGIKVDRLVVMRRSFANEIRKTVFPKRTFVVRLNSTLFPERLIVRTAAFITIYLLVILTATFIAALMGYSLTDAFFMSTSAMGCSGLGYGATGASYAGLLTPMKWILMLLMLAGRLELFTFLVLFLPSFWKR